MKEIAYPRFVRTAFVVGVPPTTDSAIDLIIAFVAGGTTDSAIDLIIKETLRVHGWRPANQHVRKQIIYRSPT